MESVIVIVIYKYIYIYIHISIYIYMIGAMLNVGHITAASHRETLEYIRTHLDLFGAQVKLGCGHDLCDEL